MIPRASSLAPPTGRKKPRSEVMIPDTGAQAAAGLHRRPRPEATGVTAGIELDESTRRATLPDGAEVVLTPLQFAILDYLVTRVGRPCSREAIMCDALGYARPIGSRTVDMHVASLRSKLGPTVPINAVRGVGYVVPRAASPGTSGGRGASH